MSMGKARLIRKITVTLLMYALSILGVSAADTFVSFDKGDMMLCKKGETFSIVVSDNDNIAVKPCSKESR